MKTHSYNDEETGGSGGANVRWNGIALIGRQGIILVVSVLLARILGPEAYGIIAQATVFTALASLILDQGLTASLISQKSVTGSLAGAATSVNLLLALALFIGIWLLAGAVASFFGTPELSLILPVLGASLLFKAVAVVPRMLLTRRLRFAAIAAGEVYSALAGGLVGLALAFLGFGYWSIVAQLVVTDVIAAIIFVVTARPPAPNLRLGELAESIGFGTRVFFGNLVSFTSRNIDNLLLGKVHGAVQLGYYSLAYRVLLTPVQMIGQTVSRVLFPAIARVKDSSEEVSRLLVKSTRSIALASFPLMTFVAISASDTVILILGQAWAPAIPVLVILAITGGRQAVTSTNAPLLLGMGRADIHLRFSLTAAFVQIGGIVAGLPFGIVGVAWGYTIAGFVLTPLIGYLQKLLAGTPYRTQLAALMAPLVCSLAGAVPYLMLYPLELPLLTRILVGGLAFLAVFAITLRFMFRSSWSRAKTDLMTLVPQR